VCVCVSFGERDMEGKRDILVSEERGRENEEKEKCKEKKKEVGRKEISELIRKLNSVLV
jgi:hypothetical protein